MGVYIRGIGCISPQKKDFIENKFNDIVTYNLTQLKCIEPKTYFYKNKAKLIGRTVNLGVFASRCAMNDAGVKMPDAFIYVVSNALLENSNYILQYAFDEFIELDKSTGFILSSHLPHYTQVLAFLREHNGAYNYLHKGLCFESGLLDAFMFLQTSKNENVLIGDLGLKNNLAFNIEKKLGLETNEKIVNLSLFDEKRAKTITGEAINFFVLSSKKENAYAKIEATSILFNPYERYHLESKIQNLFKQQHFDYKDIDVVLIGKNGIAKSDWIYDYIIDCYFSKAGIAVYKHLCGEYFTSSAFALTVAAGILKHQVQPEVLFLKKAKTSKINRILIINHYKKVNFSFIILSAVQS